MNAQDERDRQQRARNHWQTLKSSITTGPGPAQWRDHTGPAQFCAKTGRWTGTILFKDKAGSTHPVDFCTKTGRWRNHIGQFCEPPDDVIKLEDYEEPPLSPRSYDPGRVVFLQRKQANKLGLTGAVRAKIVRSMPKSVPLSSESWLGGRMFRKSSVLRTHEAYDGGDWQPSHTPSPCHTPILYTSEGEVP